MSLEIRLFGSFSLQYDSHPLPPTRTRKEQWLLALLVLRQGEATDRALLADWLWPESEEKRARLNLRRSLNDLRNVLGREAARLRAPTSRSLCFDTTGADIDLLAFDAAIARGDVISLCEATALYRGPLLEGCTETWLLRERYAREQQYLSALETLAAHAMERHNPTEAIRSLRQVIALEPERESAQAALLKALAAHGDYAAMTTAYQAFRLYLHRELNGAPSPETTALYHRLQQETTPAPRQTGTPSQEAATHTAATFPPEPAGYAPALYRQLIGREEDIRYIQSLLREGALVTLTGIGGIGKTCLAQALSRESRSAYTDRVWFVALADLNDPGRLPETLRAALRLDGQTGDEPMVQVVAHLTGPPSLLILDNFEQLLPEGASLLQVLRARLPELTLLVTSRQTLDLPGEQVYSVPALPADASQQLFLVKAQSRRPDFALNTSNREAFTQVCDALEGIPLAIELAAAWTPVLTLEQMLARISPRLLLLTTYRSEWPERHRSLGAVLESSYRLLAPELQRFFARCSIFRGGWTLEMAEAICEETRALEYLSRLHDTSLLSAEATGAEMRYRLLETVREFAEEQLTPEERDALAQRHAEWCQNLAEAAQPHWHTLNESEWLTRLETEYANLRAALSYLLGDEKRAEQACGLAGSLGNFWERHSRFQEGAAYLTQALSGEGISLRTRRRALIALGILTHRQGDYTGARPYFSEARRLAEEAGDREGVAEATRHLGASTMFLCEYEEARRYFEEALTGFRACGNRTEALTVLASMGVLSKNQGRYAESQSLLERAYALAVECGDITRQGSILHSLGVVAREQGDYVRARPYLLRSLEIHRAQESPYWQGVNLFDLGLITNEEGDTETAQTLLQQALTLCREVGDSFMIACCLDVLGTMACQAGQREQGYALMREALALRLKLGVKREAAYTLENLAHDCYEHQQYEQAARWIGAASVMRQKAHIEVNASPHTPHQQFLTNLRQELGEAAFVVAFETGGNMTVEEMLANVCA